MTLVIESWLAVTKEELLSVIQLEPLGWSEDFQEAATVNVEWGNNNYDNYNDYNDYIVYNIYNIYNLYNLYKSPYKYR